MKFFYIFLVVYKLPTKILLDCYAYLEIQCSKVTKLADEYTMIKIRVTRY